MRPVPWIESMLLAQVLHRADYAGRQLLSEQAIVAGTDPSFGDACFELISVQDIPDCSRAIAAHNHCTMPGPYMSYFPEERAAPA
jgi:hypothetical protein